MLNLQVFEGQSFEPGYKLFHPADAEILRNKTSIAKTMKTFAKFPMDFNIMVIMDSNRKAILAQSFEQILSNYGFTEGLTTANHISFILTSNHSGNNQMPLTAWTLLHRSIHAAHVAEASGSITFAHKVFSSLSYILQDCKTDEHIREGKSRTMATSNMYNYKGQIDLQKLINFSNIVLSMKSARQQKILTELDVIAELATQYLICGKIKLLHPEDWNLSGNRNNNDTEADVKLSNQNWIHSKMVRPVEQLDTDYVDKVIEDAEKSINDACKIFWESLVGSKLVF